MKKLFVFLFLLFLSSCKDESKINNQDEIPLEITSDFDNKELINERLKLAIEKGDTISYKKLFRDYVSSGHQNDFLCVSVKMIDNHSYPKAYYDVYYLLTYGSFKKKFYKEELAYYFLTKAYELNNEYAKLTIEELNEFEPSKKIEINSDFYKELVLSSEYNLPCEIKSILNKE